MNIHYSSNCSSFISLTNGFKTSTPVKIGLLTGNEMWEQHFTLQTKQGDV
jgi:hypothetical protein